MNLISTKLRKIWEIRKKIFHMHRYDIPAAEEIKVNLVGGCHTRFMILKCKCGKKVAFPSDNFKLALNHGTDETLKLLESLGFKV